MSENLGEIVKGIYAAFGRGDLLFILEHIASDATWGIDSVAAKEVPWYGILTGKTNIPKFFSALGENADFTIFEPHDFVVAGDQVFNHLRYEATIRQSGRRLVGFSLQHWTFRGGRVVRWRGYEDTAATRGATVTGTV